MTQAESRTLGFAVAGSLAVHLFVAVLFALWIGLSSFHRMLVPLVPVEEEPEVTIVLPEPLPQVPAPVTPAQSQSSNFIRTTQNTETQAPAKADFVSDRNTVASSTSAPSPDGDRSMPSIEGQNSRSSEVADREYRDGKLEDKSTAAAVTPPAPAPTPPVPAPPTPRMKVPDQPQVAKKDDAPAEALLKQDDNASPEKHAAIPSLRAPADTSTPPQIIPNARPVTPPKSGAFQAETTRKSMKGSLSTVGAEDAVNAALTPRGRYFAQVDAILGKNWHRLQLERAHSSDPGQLGVRFYLNKDGKVEDFDWTFREASVLVEDFTIEAIFACQFPPIPDDVPLENGRVLREYDIIIR